MGLFTWLLGGTTDAKPELEGLRGRKAAEEDLPEIVKAIESCTGRAVAWPFKKKDRIHWHNGYPNNGPDTVAPLGWHAGGGFAGAYAKRIEDLINQPGVPVRITAAGGEYGFYDKITIESTLAVDPIQDPLFGPVTWDGSWWNFEAGPIAARSIEGRILTEGLSGGNPLSSNASRSRMRARLDWIRSDEPAIRSHIGTEMIDWWLDKYPPRQDGVDTPEQFGAAIELKRIDLISDGRANLEYQDRNDLLGGVVISLSVGPQGEMLGPPRFRYV